MVVLSEPMCTWKEARRENWVSAERKKAKWLMMGLADTTNRKSVI